VQLGIPLMITVLFAFVLNAGDRGFIRRAVNVAVNIVLLPVTGIADAALATDVAFALEALLLRREVPRLPRLDRTPPALLITVVAAFAVSAASCALPQTLWWNVARFVLAVACFLWLLLRLRAPRGGPLRATRPSPAGDSGRILSAVSGRVAP